MVSESSAVIVIAVVVRFFKQHIEFEFDLQCVASADAYLTPCIKKYIRGFTAGFQDGIQVGWLVG